VGTLVSVSPARLRYVVGTARLRTAARLRRTRGQLRRKPRGSSVVPSPPLVRAGEQPLRLTHALLASDLNPQYLGLWPVARRAWAELLGIEPVLVLVAREADVPEALRNDGAVHVFEPVASLHTAYQAQCIRLLYPALLDADGAVITSDVDMAPLAPRYFHRPLAHIPRHHFVCYRDELLDLRELHICYNAALPETWSSVFGIDTLDDVRARLLEWGDGVEYTGERGGAGWTTDQLQLYRVLLARGRRERDVWILDDDFTGYRRLERAYVNKWGVLSDDARRGIERGAFSDFHLLEAGNRHTGLNELIVDFAVECAARARPQRRLLA
jgi:hypothetical protein